MTRLIRMGLLWNPPLSADIEVNARRAAEEQIAAESNESRNEGANSSHEECRPGDSSVIGNKRKRECVSA